MALLAETGKPVLTTQYNKYMLINHTKKANDIVRANVALKSVPFPVYGVRRVLILSRNGYDETGVPLYTGKDAKGKIKHFTENDIK